MSKTQRGGTATAPAATSRRTSTAKAAPAVNLSPNDVRLLDEFPAEMHMSLMEHFLLFHTLRQVMSLSQFLYLIKPLVAQVENYPSLLLGRLWDCAGEETAYRQLVCGFLECVDADPEASFLTYVDTVAPPEVVAGTSATEEVPVDEEVEPTDAAAADEQVDEDGDIGPADDVVDDLVDGNGEADGDDHDEVVPPPKKRTKAVPEAAEAGEDAGAHEVRFSQDDRVVFSLPGMRGDQYGRIVRGPLKDGTYSVRDDAGTVHKGLEAQQLKLADDEQVDKTVLKSERVRLTKTSLANAKKWLGLKKPLSTHEVDALLDTKKFPFMHEDTEYVAFVNIVNGANHPYVDNYLCLGQEIVFEGETRQDLPGVYEFELPETGGLEIFRLELVEHD